MPKGKKKPNVLIVEDNLEILEMLSTNLSRFFKVTTTPNGKEALRIAKKNPPDLALLDINVPGVDGYSLCKILKEDRETKHIKVIMLTASYTDETGKTMGIAAGADAYLTKPVRSQTLLEKAHELLGLTYSKTVSQS